MVTWKNPPLVPVGRSANVWEKRLRPVMAHRNRWARVLKCANPNLASSHVAHLKNRTYRYPEGRFEFRAHTEKDGSGGVYARYLGKEKR